MRITVDIHSHTLASGHAYNTVDEMAREASERGLKIMGMTDHAPALPGGAHPFHFHNLRALPDTLYGVRVLKGIEGNIIDHQGKIDVTDDIAGDTELVIASFHPPCITAGTERENTNTLIKVMENPLVHVIGHPTDGRFPVNMKDLVAASKATRTLLEINNATLLPTSFRPGGRKMIIELLEEASREELEVVMGSDAHYRSYLGRMDESLALMKEISFPERLVLNDRPEAFLERIGL